jgi:hypothetical protein
MKRLDIMLSKVNNTAPNDLKFLARDFESKAERAHEIAQTTDNPRKGRAASKRYSDYMAAAKAARKRKAGIDAANTFTPLFEKHNVTARTENPGRPFSWIQGATYRLMLVDPSISAADTATIHKAAKLHLRGKNLGFHNGYYRSDRPLDPSPKAQPCKVVGNRFVLG